MTMTFLFGSKKHQDVQLSQSDLDYIYHNLSNHHIKPTQIAQSYGEMLYPSVERLRHAILWTTHDIFFDLGSGLGKVVIQLFLNTKVKMACGIEIVTPLHQKANLALKKLKALKPNAFLNERQIHFYHDDFLNGFFSRATIILIASPCFGQGCLDQIGRLIDCHDNIHTVFTLKPILTMHRLVFTKAIRVECSWDSALCYIYQRR